MVGRLNGKVAVVTGAASGIGLESSLLFAKEGAKVVCVDLDIAGATEVVGKIAKLVGLADSAIPFRADVSKEQDVKAAVDAAVEKFGKRRPASSRGQTTRTRWKVPPNAKIPAGRLDVMFNNAGQEPMSRENLVTLPSLLRTLPRGLKRRENLLKKKRATFLFRDLTMNINLKGVWWGCKYAVLAMRKFGGGSIINTASFVAIMGAATPQLACKIPKQDGTGRRRPPASL
ncbi:MAG: hypothetical protein BJ554DRAFT_427, partial [Olpidium bornovanus]